MKLSYNKKLYLIIIFYIGIMIFYSEVSSLFISIIQCLFNYIVYKYFRQRNEVYFSVLLLLTLQVPLSFVSVIGTSYASVPVTWYTVLLLYLGVYSLTNGRVNKKMIILSILTIFYLVVNICFKNYHFDALKQFLIIVLYIFAYFIGFYSKKTFISNEKIKLLEEIFIISVVGFALQIYIQYFYINSTGSIIGHYAQMGMSRNSYAGLFNDYSFAGVYLASGLLLIIKNIVESKIEILNLFMMFFISFAMIITSSRTGVFALIASLAYYFIRKMFSLNLKTLIILFISIVFTFLFLDIILSNRGGIKISDDSGRSEQYIAMLPIIKQNLLFGIGMGIDHLETITRFGIPHNYFIQYFTQIGLVGTILLTSYFLFICKQENKYFISILHILISSMFIPDIVNSRFIVIIIILCFMSSNSKKFVERRN